MASRIDATLDAVIARPRCRRAGSTGRLDLVERARLGDLEQQARHRGPPPGRRPRRRDAGRCPSRRRETVRAGDIRTLDLPHSRTSSPRSKQAHWTSSACSAVSNSTPIIRPLPRTSRTSSGTGRRAARDPTGACSPRAAALAIRPPSSRSIVASAAAQATGLPPNVEPWAPGPQASSARRGRSCAPSGIPRGDALGASGGCRARRPSARSPTSCPVRPAPDWTSSAISRMPCSSQMSRRPWRKPSSGTT